MSLTERTREAGHALIDGRGWSVFLVNVTDKGKIPFGNCADCPPHGNLHDAQACDHLLCHGFYAATTDHERFDRMCDARPDGALAVRTGAASGIVVIDAESTSDRDDQLTGVETLDQWNVLFDWTLPKTLTQRTASGGLHLVYAYPAGALPIKTRGRVLPSIDLKADGGYVVVPPAPGRYWLDDAAPVVQPSAELAAWLATTRGRRSLSTRVASEDGQTERPVGYDFNEFMASGAPAGMRDEFFNDLAYRLRRRGVAYEVAVERVTEAWHRADKSGSTCLLEHAVEKVDRVWASVQPEEAPIVMAPAAEPSPTVELDPDDQPPDVATANGTLSSGATVTAEQRVENATDLGNSLRFARLLSNEVRFTADEGRWYVWDGRRWVPDARGLRALERTKAVIDDLYALADSTFGDDQRLWSRWANTSESIGHRRAMLDGAAAEPQLRTTVDAFDRNPWLLVTRSGTLDLRACVFNGECAVREGRREDLCTRMAEVDYDPTAPDARWREHVGLVTRWDVNLAAYLRRVIGYTLTGDTSEQAFFFFEGSGSNGKNALIEPIVQMMGSYAMVGTSALLTGGDEQHPTILADLVGQRLVFVDETRKGRALNVERVKALTGSQRIKARRMREDFFEYNATFKLWVAGNDHPTIRDPSDGVWRRMHRIMCNAKIGAGQRVRDYGTLLYQEEASGILNWAIEGLRDYVAIGGLGPPDQIRADVEEYRDEEDPIGQFVDECCEVTGDARDEISVAALYAAFTMWCYTSGIRNADRPPRRQFGRQVTQRLGTKISHWNRRIDGTMTRGYGGIKIAGVA